MTRIFPLSAGKAVRDLVPQPTLADFKISVQEQSQKRPLILISGFIHDASDFIEEHPGGPHLLIKMIGKDATTAFFGGVYDHSNAAHNVCWILIVYRPPSNLSPVARYETCWRITRWRSSWYRR